MKTVPTDNILASTLRAIGDGVISCDREGHVYMMNAVAEDLTGWKEQEALGRPLKEVFVIVHENSRETVEDPVDKVLRLGAVVGMANHTILIRRDGTELAIDDSAAPVHNADGELRGVVLVFRDVTARRHAEFNQELLSSSGKVLGEAVDANAILSRIDHLITLHFADLAIFDLLLPSGDLERRVGRHRLPDWQHVVDELYHFIPKAEVSAHPTRAALETKAPILVPVVTDELIQAAAMSLEHLEFFRNRLKPRSVLAVPVIAEGKHLGVLTFIRNCMVTPFNPADLLAGEELGVRVGLALKRADERKRIEEREAFLAAILESVPVGLLVSDEHGKTLFGNRELNRVTGHNFIHSSSAQEYGERFAYTPEGRRLEAQEYPLARALSAGETSRHQLFRYGPDESSLRWVSISNSPVRTVDGRLVGAIVAIQDIHEQRLDQEKLAASERELRSILSSTHDRVTVIDQDANIVSINTEGAQRLGFKDESAYAGTPWISYWGGPYKAEAQRALDDARRSGLGQFEGELVTKAGEKTWWDATITAIRQDGEFVDRFLVISRESTEKRQAELNLRRSEERFRALIDRASIGINIGDSKGALTYINPALLSLIGYTREEVERGEVRWDQLTPSQYAQPDQNALQQLSEVGFATPYEKAYRAKDGRLVPMLLGANLIPALEEDSEQQDIAVFFTDLTRQKRAEAALVQTEKLAAVGKLASTISHEINNPLEAVTNLLFIVRQDPALSQGSRDYLQVADRELARVSQVTAQTLRFHRQSTAALTVKPESLIDEVLELYAARLNNSRIAVRREYAPNVFVTCYEGDVRQVLNNLIGNAIDAMRTGGRLVARTRAARRWSTGVDGIRITIADTGTGMTREVLNQIFEAFFTTKGINGTGLGLWISSRIVHKHRGHLQAYSSVAPQHHGAAFSLWLPLTLASTAKDSWQAEEGML